jgi:hypothetical protein
VGAHRHDQDPDAGLRLGPKLTVTGRLSLMCDGRPVELAAGGREIVLRVPSLRSAWAFRRGLSATTLPLMRAVAETGCRLVLRIGARLELELLPETHFLLRMLYPSLHCARQES